MDGRDRQLIPKQAAILTIVAQHLAAMAPLADRLADGRDSWLVVVLALEEAAILIEDVVRGVSGEALEGRVGVDQDAVVAFLLSDDDAIVGAIDH
ncbi:hypothetical protein D3C81_2017030 [compost metagenome]